MTHRRVEDSSRRAAHGHHDATASASNRRECIVRLPRDIRVSHGILPLDWTALDTSLPNLNWSNEGNDTTSPVNSRLSAPPCLSPLFLGSLVFYPGAAALTGVEAVRFAVRGCHRIRRVPMRRRPLPGPRPAAVPIQALVFAAVQVRIVEILH